MTFLEERQERVSNQNKNLDSLVSFFPDQWWPGFTGFASESKEISVAKFPLLEADNVWSCIKNQPYCTGGSIPIVDKKSFPPFHNTNDEWEEILKGLNHVGRPSGEGEFLRPEGRYVTDLIKTANGRGILEAAHIITHARAMALGDSTRIKTGFLECLGELVLALRWDTTIFCPTPEQIAGSIDRDSIPDFFCKYGIKIVVSSNFRKPWLTMNAVGPNGPRPSKDTVAVLINLHVEPEPWSTREGNPNSKDSSWLELNRWSCMPSIVCIAGWKCLDELMKAPLIYPYRNANMHKEDICVTLPTTALDPVWALEAMVEQVHNSLEDVAYPELGVYKARELVNSDVLKPLAYCTPPFPCIECLKLNMMSPGAPTRPSCKRPEVKRYKSYKKDEADLEWEAYDAKVLHIVEVVKKACSFYDKRFNTSLVPRKLREKTSKAATKILGIIRSCMSRAEKYSQKMELTKRDIELAKAEAAKQELLKLTKGIKGEKGE